MQGVQGASGPAWLYQPTPAQLDAKVRKAALDVSARTLVDPRVGARYVGNRTSRLLKLQGGLLLRAVLTTDPPVPAVTVQQFSNVRSIA